MGLIPHVAGVLKRVKKQNIEAVLSSSFRRENCASQRHSPVALPAKKKRETTAAINEMPF